VGEEHGLPWWIDGGEENCPFCGQAYAYEMERRCDYCDGPVCPWCCVHAEPDTVCPECIPCREGGV